MGTEWIGGLVSMPTYVAALDGEEPYRPEALFWMSAEGAVLGSSVGKPGTMLASASTSLRETMERPKWGSAHVPSRVRVPTSELAAAIREGHPELDVIWAPAPELDAMVSMLIDRLAEDDPDPSYLTPGLDPEAVASLFRAAAGLYRAAPWAIVPDDESLLGVTIEKLGIDNAVLSVFGQLGSAFGWCLFSDHEAFEAFVAYSELEEAERTPPRHFALRFEQRSDLGAAAQRELDEHGWEIADAGACPWISAVDDDLLERPPTARELTIAEAISLALPELLKKWETALNEAWSGNGAVVQTLGVQTHAGAIEVTLSVTRDEARELPSDLLGALRELEEDSEIDPGARAELEEELLRRFAQSPEAETLGELAYCDFVLDAAADCFGVTVASLDPVQLEEILFEIMPRKFSVEASVAQDVIDETRAFYAFLKREFGLKQADSCLKVLRPDAVTRLRAELSNPDNFGMAKSLFMSGSSAGFDMHSQAGMNAWMNAVNARQLHAFEQSSAVRGAPRTSKKASKQKKKERKAARNARKKNR